MSRGGAPTAPPVAPVAAAVRYFGSGAGEVLAGWTALLRVERLAAAGAVD
jgi:hypothetical protein